MSTTALNTARRKRQGGAVTKFEVTREVRKSDLPAPARLVMLVLADLADTDGVIPEQYTPSLTTLADQTGLSRSAVAAKLTQLVDAGWVERTAPSVADARSKKARTQYRITVPVVLSLVQDTDQSTTRTSPSDGLVQDMDQPDQDEPGHDDQSTSWTSPPQGLVTDLSSPGGGHVPSSSSPTEKKTSSKHKRSKRVEETPEFVEFYEQAYPRREARARARKAWTTAVEAVDDPSEIITAARRHADHYRRVRKERRFIPLPATWLNDERWKDDLPSPAEDAPPQRSSVKGYRNEDQDHSDWKL